MLTRLTLVVACVAALWFPLGGVIAAESEQEASYDPFLEDSEVSADRAGNKPQATTWTTGSGEGGEIEAVDVDQSYELLQDASLLDLNSLGPQVPDTSILSDPGDLSLTAILQSNDNMPADEPRSIRDLVRMGLIGFGVMLFGALIGVGVELLRVKYGKRTHREPSPKVPR